MADRDDAPPPAAEPAAVPQPPRLVERIVVGYDLSALPLTVIQNCALLRRKLEREGYRVEVLMRPLDQLPPEVAVLFVTEHLLERGRQAAPQARVLTLTGSVAHQPAFDELLELLRAGTEFYAKRQQEDASRAEPGRVIVRYRGHERID